MLCPCLVREERSSFLSSALPPLAALSLAPSPRPPPPLPAPRLLSLDRIPAPRCHHHHSQRNCNGIPSHPSHTRTHTHFALVASKKAGCSQSGAGWAVTATVVSKEVGKALVLFSLLIGAVTLVVVEASGGRKLEGEGKRGERKGSGCSGSLEESRRGRGRGRDCCCGYSGRTCRARGWRPQFELWKVASCNLGEGFIRHLQLASQSRHPGYGHDWFVDKRKKNGSFIP